MLEANSRALTQLLISFVAALAITGCATPQAPEDAQFDQVVEVVSFATDPNAADVVASLHWMSENQRFVSIGYLFSQGTHDDIIMEVVKLQVTQTTSKFTSAYSSEMGRIMGLRVTPYQTGWRL